MRKFKGIVLMAVCMAGLSAFGSVSHAPPKTEIKDDAKELTPFDICELAPMDINIELHSFSTYDAAVLVEQWHVTPVSGAYVEVKSPVVAKPWIWRYWCGYHPKV